MGLAAVVGQVGHAVLRLDRAPLCGDRDRVPERRMRLPEAPVVERGQHAAVHEQERLVERQRGEDARGVGGLVVLRVADPYAVTGSLPSKARISAPSSPRTRVTSTNPC
jgi:hypothetical protein